MSQSLFLEFEGLLDRGNRLRFPHEEDMPQQVVDEVIQNYSNASEIHQFCSSAFSEIQGNILDHGLKVERDGQSGVPARIALDFFHRANDRTGLLMTFENAADPEKVQRVIRRVQKYMDIDQKLGARIMERRERFPAGQHGGMRQGIADSVLNIRSISPHAFIKAQEQKGERNLRIDIFAPTRP